MKPPIGYGVPHHCGRPCVPLPAGFWTCFVCKRQFIVSQGGRRG